MLVVTRDVPLVNVALLRLELLPYTRNIGQPSPRQIFHLQQSPPTIASSYLDFRYVPSSVTSQSSLIILFQARQCLYQRIGGTWKSQNLSRDLKNRLDSMRSELDNDLESNPEYAAGLNDYLSSLTRE